MIQRHQSAGREKSLLCFNEQILLIGTKGSSSHTQDETRYRKLTLPAKSFRALTWTQERHESFEDPDYML